MTISKYRGFGGHEIVINNLCNGLNQIGYETYLGAFHFEIEPPEFIKRVNLSKFKDFAKASQGKPFDIIHNHHTLLNYYALVSSKPFIYHYHGAGSTLQEINVKISMTLCGNKISRTIAVSDTASNQLERILGRTPVDVVYNGVDIHLFKNGLSGPYTKGNPQLLFVGVLYPSKNVETLILGMEKILKRYPAAHLQIVGEGRESSRLESLVNKRGLKNKIEFVGGLSHDELALRYSSCDVYVSASLCETFALPVFEAMACGKPVVLSDIPMHKDLIAQSNAGLTFSDVNDLATKIEEAYQRKEALEVAARKFAEKYDWSNLCNRVAGIYEEILSRNH